jgi:hypothetical protein
LSKTGMCGASGATESSRQPVTPLLRLESRSTDSTNAA